MFHIGVYHQRQKPGVDAVLGSWNTELRHEFMRIDPIDHSSSNWSVVPYQSYCITTISGATITALGVDIGWKSSDLLLYESNSPGMAAQVSTTAAPTKTVTTPVTITVSQAAKSHTHKLGTGAEIGIGIGGATLVLICFASLVAFLVLRKKRRRTSSTKPGPANDSASNARELAHDLAGGAYNEPMELRAKPKAKFRTCEIDSNPLLEAYNGPIELRAKCKQNI